MRLVDNSSLSLLDDLTQKAFAISQKIVDYWQPASGWSNSATVVLSSGKTAEHRIRTAMAQAKKVFVISEKIAAVTGVDSSEAEAGSGSGSRLRAFAE